MEALEGSAFFRAESGGIEEEGGGVLHEGLDNKVQMVLLTMGSFV